MELSGKSGGAGGIIYWPSEYIVDVRVGERALCAEYPQEGLGDGARYFERRGFGSTSRGVVSPDLGRMDPTDVAWD